MSAPAPVEDERLAAVASLAHTCGVEDAHARQVTRLALRLFDQLAGLHGLGARERFLLHAAALLHDIGWVEGGRGHHKASLRIIMRTSLLPFTHTERLIAGGVARYHTRALPSLAHDHYAALDEPDRRVVRVLAGCLRLADALDDSHQSLVESIVCRAGERRVTITILTPTPAPSEQQAANRQTGLLAEALEREVALVWVEDD